MMKDQDQGVSQFDSWWERLSWPVEGHILAVSLYDTDRELVVFLFL